MTCSELHPEIALLVGGELPPGRLPAIERHLETCSACRELAAALDADRRALRSLAREPGQEPTHGSADDRADRAALARIRGRVRAAVATEDAARRRRALGRRRRTRALLALAAGLAALGLALAVWFSPLRTRPGQARQADARESPTDQSRTGRTATDRALTDRTPADRAAHEAPPAPAPTERSAGPEIEHDTGHEPSPDRIADRTDRRPPGAGATRFPRAHRAPRPLRRRPGRRRRRGPVDHHPDRLR